MGGRGKDIHNILNNKDKKIIFKCQALVFSPNFLWFENLSELIVINHKLACRIIIKLNEYQKKKKR